MVEEFDFDESSFRNICRAVAGDAAALRDLLRGSGQSLSRTLDDLDIVLDQATELRLAVIGDFKRGKSSVINAVVGEDVLPTDVLPCTSGIIDPVMSSSRSRVPRARPTRSRMSPRPGGFERRGCRMASSSWIPRDSTRTNSASP
jgi:hypothetical protein